MSILLRIGVLVLLCGGGMTVAWAQATDDSSVASRSHWIMAGYGATVAYVGYKSWWSESSDSFHFTNEGWLGSNTSRGGADKFGHGYTSYLSTRLLSESLQAAGNSPEQALNYASWTAGITTFGIEVLDGFTDEFGFSYEDMVFNLAGIVTARFMEQNPWWDQRFDLRFHYQQSADSKRLNEGDALGDYSGQTYLLMGKFGGFNSFKNNPWLRYLELGVGYGSRGYHPTDGSTAKQRKLFFAFSLNLSEILNQSIYRQREYPRSQYVTGQLFEYWQVPATTIMSDIKF